MQNRNDSLFSVNPVNIDISRTKFPRPFRNSTTFNVGKLIPFYVDEVLPGDTFDIETSAMIRFSSPLSIPLLDELFIDFYYFFVPMRLVWNHSKEFFGENNESAWIPSVNYSIPMLRMPRQKITRPGLDPTFYHNAYGVGSPMNYMGIPLNEAAHCRAGEVSAFDMFEYNALPMRGYCLIWNNFFRDQNLQDPVFVPMDDATRTPLYEGSNVFDYNNPPSDYDLTAKAYEGLVCLPVNKTHDYFTSCLPGPQKGPSVGFNFAGLIPVRTNDVVNPGPALNKIPLKFAGYNNDIPTDFSNGNSPYLGTNGNFSYSNQSVAGSRVGTLTPTNLVADMGLGTFGTVNELRQAFQVQKFFEKLARGGSRYKEIVKSMFNVDSADSRVQIPEYLGGSRQFLDISQVAQTSENGTTPLGSLGAISQTPYYHKDFVKSFTEHGYLFGLCCVRYDHKYANGVDKLWSRRSRFDFYYPVFANLGEQAVKMREIYGASDYSAGADVDKNNENIVFGYQERYAEYRYKRSYCSGHFASDQRQWTLTDFYSANPALSASWIAEDKGNVDRCLQVSSELTHQVYADIYVKNDCTRPMPLHSIPGLIDHH